MPANVVAYERFLDVRQRRTRGAATLTFDPRHPLLEPVLDYPAAGTDS